MCPRIEERAGTWRTPRLYFLSSAVRLNARIQESASTRSGDSGAAARARTTDGDFEAEPDGENSAAARDAEEEASAEGASGAGGMSLIIRGAQIVNDDSVFFADVLIQDGVIR